MNSKNKFSGFVGVNGTFLAQSKNPTLAALKPGVYDLEIDMQGTLFFKEINTVHDELVDLPGTAFDTVVTEMESFLRPETRKALKDFGFTYKRSSLLYGPPGTGKTCIVNRVISSVIKAGGIVLFNPHPQLVTKAYDQLQDIQPETTVLTIFEEVDKLIQRYEGDLLNILDGEVQKENVIYLATTNFIDKIPARIRRPGRFSSLVKVGYPNKSARSFYLKTKLEKAGYPMSQADFDNWVAQTKGFSIDEVTECIRASLCLGQQFEEVVARINSLRDVRAQDFSDEDGEIIEKMESIDYTLEDIPESAEDIANKEMLTMQKSQMSSLAALIQKQG